MPTLDESYRTYTLNEYSPTADYDCKVFIAPEIASIKQNFPEESQALAEMANVDKTIGNSVSASVFDSKLVIFSCTGPLTRDYDDVRMIHEAATRGVQRAIDAGKRNVLLVVSTESANLLKHPEKSQYSKALEVGVQGALVPLYIPLEVRERAEYKRDGVNVSVFDASAAQVEKSCKIEQALIVGRDLGGSDPERTAPQGIVDYIHTAFKGLNEVTYKVISDFDTLEKEYPCFGAVNRCTKNVPRHHGRVVIFEYRNGTPEEHICLVGKGVTYDTGGADIKAGGVMAGMHRDKCGASNAIGFMHAIGTLKPKDTHVTVAVALVRNSVGSECYVADEIIKNRVGKYIRIGNTDAEGRMAMVDVLCHMKERALSENWIKPQFFTWATLTGHSCLAFGEHYSACMSNGPARLSKTCERLMKFGHLVADPFELSTTRREDHKAHAGKDIYSDLLQANNAPSTRTPRGHQNPSAFMTCGSGLDAHGNDSDRPLAYTHIDMAPSAGPFPGLPTGNPIRAFLETFVFSQGKC